MNNVLLDNGFVASSEDEIKVATPKAKGGISALEKRKHLKGYSLEIAVDYFNQAITSIQKAQKIIQSISKDLNEAN